MTTPTDVPVGRAPRHPGRRPSASACAHCSRWRRPWPATCCCWRAALPGMDPVPDALAGDWGLALVKQAIPMLTVPLLAIGLIALLTRFVDRRPFRMTGLALDARTVPALLLGTALSLLVVVPAGVLLTRLQLVPPRSAAGEPCG
ncbi:MAG: hypothetical protein R2719_00955 [Micropruina sp.]